MSEAIPTPPPPLPARVYPLPVAENDPRFTFVLVADVGRVLVEHGYPKPGPLDHLDLQQTLYGFLHIGEGR